MEFSFSCFQFSGAVLTHFYEQVQLFKIKLGGQGWEIYA